MEPAQKDLITLIQQGRIAKAIEAIEQGANVNGSDEFRRTPLHGALAIVTGIQNATCYFSPGSHYPLGKLWLRLIKSLLTHGADPNAATDTGHTALHMAPNDTIATMLLDHGARVDVRNNAGQTPCDREPAILFVSFYSHFQTAIEHEDQETIKRMLDQGALFGWYELELAAKHPIAQWKYDEGYGTRPSTIELLLTHPLPGVVSESTQIIRAKKEWLAFACVLNRKEKTEELILPREVRKLLCSYLFPPLASFIAQVPTKRLPRYLPLFGKKALLAAAITRHVARLQAKLDLPIDHESRLAQTIRTRKAVAEVLDPLEIEYRFLPLIEQSYGELFEV